MAKVKVSEVTNVPGVRICFFWCPGCNEPHGMNVGVAVQPHYGAKWQFNEDVEKPTLSPSILVRTGHYVPGQTGSECWCTYNKEHADDPAPFTCTVCHSFVKEGRIQFLGDCTHALAGQTVDLPEWED